MISAKQVQAEIDATFQEKSDTILIRLNYLNGYLRGLEEAGGITTTEYFTLREYVQHVYKRLARTEQ